MTNRLSAIQSLRGWAAFMVFAAHCIGLQPMYCFTDGHWQRNAVEIGAAGVDIFFVVSGFIMVHVTSRLENSWRSALRFLMERMGRIYPMYWIWLGIAVIVYLLRPHWIYKTPGQMPHYWASFFLFPAANAPVLRVGWTLIHEVYFYIVFSIFLLAIPKKALVFALLIWAIAIVSLRHAFPEIMHPAWVLATHPLTLEFIGGAFLGIWFSSGMRPSGFPVRNLIAACLALPLFKMASLLLPWGMDSDWMRVIFAGFPAVMIVAAAAALEKQPGYRAPSWMVALGDMSYSLYLSHTMVIIVGYGWLKTNGRFCLWELPVLGLLVGIWALAVGAAGHILLEKPTQRMAKRFIESRFPPGSGGTTR
jgi:exopolysaccharide production protein ExoZ